MEGQLSKYERYKKIISLRKSKIVDEFEKLIYSSSDVSLEFSNKIQENLVFRQRINIWWYRDPLASVSAIFRFLDRISKDVQLDRSPLQKLLMPTRLKGVRYVVLGIDLRDEKKESRVKVWTIVQNPGKSLQELEKEFPDLSAWGDILRLFRIDDIAYGVNMFFDGRTTPRGFYACIHGDEIRNQAFLSRLNDFFGQKVINLVRLSRQVEVSFDGSSDRVLHFHPASRHVFLTHLNNEIVHEVDRVFSHNEYDLNVVSLLESGVNQDKLRTINLYYI